MGRPTVTKITVEFEKAGGVKGTRIIDTTKGDELPEAIFFGDMGVYDILTPFYTGKTIQMTKDEVKKNWKENIANAIYGSTAKDDTLKTIDASFIKDAWTTKDDNGDLLVMMMKMPACPLI